jgi:hypothetical protein
MYSGNKLSWLTLLFILLLYIIFPSGLSTGDAWSYAASIKYVSDIFHPHHLLYNGLGLIFCLIPSKLGIDVLSCMKVMNAIFAFLTLIVLQKILSSYKIPDKSIIVINCLAGLSFAVLRYATENETYIVPLFFALLASLNYAKFIESEKYKYALYSGLWASLSVLFHQTYMFWWLGLMIAFIIEKKRRSALLYLTLSLIVPITYLLVIFLVKGDLGWNTVTDFIFGEFRGNARLEISNKGIILSAVNLIRSFIQVHGYMLNMFKANLLFLIPGIASFIFFLLAFLKLPERSSPNVSKNFSIIHVGIIIIQYLFAVVSFGNAEFMVMIPVLFFMLIPFFTINYHKFLTRLLIALAVWNISYGLLPLHYKNQEQEQFLYNACSMEKDVIIIATDAQQIKSMLYYREGVLISKKVFQSPAFYAISGQDPTVLEAIIDSTLNAGGKVYTNCLDETVISRLSIISGNRDKDFFTNYKSAMVKSWYLPGGTKSIYRIEKKL